MASWVCKASSLPDSASSDTSSKMLVAELPSIEIVVLDEGINEHSRGGWRWFLGDWRKHKLHAGSCCNSGTNLRGVANPRRNPRQFLLKKFFGSYCMSTRCFFFTTFCGVFQQKFVATNNRTKTTRKPNQTIKTPFLCSDQAPPPPPLNQKALHRWLIRRKRRSLLRLCMGQEHPCT